MLVSLTVGKVDAGVTVLLTPDKRLIEFPSILLPPNIQSGSIVDITVARNHGAETAADKQFSELQDRIFGAFGAAEPSTPVLRCRNATQTSVVLEWDPMELATADLISLSLFRNGQKAGNIPRPLQMHSTKISGLAVDTEYTFHLLLRTTAGTFASKQVAVRTHKMTDLSGITITTGILPAAARENLNSAVERIGAKIADSVRIDTTHFVTTEGRGVAWEKAVEMNIPVVRPEWVEACERSGRILGVTKFYLDAVRPGPGDFDELRGSPQPQSRQVSTSTPAATSTPTTTTTTTTTTPAANKDKELPSEPTPAKDEAEKSNGAEAKKDKETEDADNDGDGDGNGSVDERDKDEDDDREEEEEEKDDRDNDEGDEDQDGPGKSRSAADAEQKVRLEDRDAQKVALRPAAASRNGSSMNVVTTGALEDPDEDEDGKKKKKETVLSPVDGAAFQDVAL